MSRRGATRRADISPHVLAGLNKGTLESVNLMEWLAADMAALVTVVLPEVGLGSMRTRLAAEVRQLPPSSVTKRLQWIGASLFGRIADSPERSAVFDSIASHPSDIVRQWGAYIVAADPHLDLADRLQATRRFAADRNMSVRECAWMAFRPHLVADLARGIELLKSNVTDVDPNIRRFAVEVTRPRSVWGAHIPALKYQPEPGLPLLEPVRSDPSRYVQRAVANWLNDVSKTNPDWVRRLCRAWGGAKAPSPTRWIIKRALRSTRR
jgi:3-methyladenine DNA glycosylase AlkC